MPTAKPAVSDRKRAANRANAQKSTGPKTVEGKAKVKNNATKHGLRAEQVVLPWEDADAFEAMRQTWIDEWKPPTDARRALVELGVAQAWMVRRGIGQHRDKLAELGYAAMDRYDREVEARVTRGLNLLSLQPERALGMLMSDRAGVEALAGLWAGLAEDLDSPSSWSHPFRHHGRLLNLLGHPGGTPPDRVGEAACASCLLIQYSDPAQLPAGEPPIEPEEAEDAASVLRLAVADTIEGLRESLAGLPDPDRARLDAARAGAFDPSPEGLARLRYMGHHERSFRANLNQLIALTRSGTDLVEEAGAATQVIEPDPVTSPTPVAPNKATEAVATRAEAAPIAAPNGATEPTPARAAVAPNKATAPEPCRASTRDRDGRIWPVSARQDAPDGPGTGEVDDVAADDGSSSA